MFVDNDVKKVFDKFEDTQINSNPKLKYIHNKIMKHGYLAINLSELNYLNYLNGISIKYDMNLLKSLLHNNGIGYTSIIKNIGIPKATLSKLLNSDRNVKLLQLNNLFNKLNNKYQLKLNKETIEKGV